MKKVFLTGITGQICSFMAEYLLERGFDVHGLIRRSSSFNTGRIDHLYENPDIGYKTLHLHYGDLSDGSSLNRIIEKVQPDYIINAGAQSHVSVSFSTGEYTSDIVGLGVLRILDAIKDNNYNTRFLQMSSSEMFGGIKGSAPQSETTPFYPKSPYGCAKVFGYNITVNYRENYNMFASNSINFNTESERRGETFVTRKITQGINKILTKERDVINIGNLYAKRDWSYCLDIVDGLWKILNHNKPDDFVLASGETHSIKEFIELAFKEVGIDIIWKGTGLDEIGINSKTNKTIVKIDSRFFRPSEVDILQGDASKAKRELNWKPKTSFEELVKIMMKHDCGDYIYG